MKISENWLRERVAITADHDALEMHFVDGRVERLEKTIGARLVDRLNNGATLTLELHYTPDGVPHADRTTIAIKFARTLMIRWGYGAQRLGSAARADPQHHRREGGRCAQKRIPSG